MSKLGGGGRGRLFRQNPKEEQLFFREIFPNIKGFATQKTKLSTQLSTQDFSSQLEGMKLGRAGLYHAGQRGGEEGPSKASFGKRQFVD